MMTKQKTKVIQTVPMCKFLLRRGFTITDVVLSKKTGNTAFVFEYSKELSDAIEDYNNGKR